MAVDPPAAPPTPLALLNDPVVQRMLRDSNYHLLDFSREHTLQDIASLVSDYARPAQCIILAFALELPPSLVSTFWSVLWTADASRGEVEREEDALSVVLHQL